MWDETSVEIGSIVAISKVSHGYLPEAPSLSTSTYPFDTHSSIDISVSGSIRLTSSM